jgi:membrane-associated phospholipid phosphatase
MFRLQRGIEAFNHAYVIFVTDLADQAVILPAAVVIALMLALTGWKRGMFVWLAAVSGTIATIAVLKIGIAACGPVQLRDLVNSPSGHAASGAIIYGGLIGLLLRHLGAGRGVAMLPALLIAAVIGVTRIELGAHNLPEVVIGGAVGCAGVAAILLLAGAPPRRLQSARLLAPVALIVAVMHGYHLHGEDVIRKTGQWEWLTAVCSELRIADRR